MRISNENNSINFSHRKYNSLLAKGYVIIEDIKDDSVYDYDKWIIRSPENNKRKTNTTYIDFSVIENEELRYGLKKYLYDQGGRFSKTVDEKNFRYIL